MSKNNIRILLKMSWEALAWWEQKAFDKKTLNYLLEILKDLQKENIQIAIVIWWWNIYRWIYGKELELDPNIAHFMWMTATYINWLALVNYFSKNNLKSKLMTSVNYEWVWERFDKEKAIKYLENWKIVVFAWGTWNPYFTTDTGWVLRAIEIEADMIIKATWVDWVYSSDPKKDKNAKIFKKITYDEILEKNLKVMDLTAIALARDEKVLLKVVNFRKKQAIKNAVLWKDEGTEVS